MIGHVLSKAREEVGLTQEELAARARVDRSYLSDVERGETSLSLHKFLEVCRGLGLPAVDVIARIERAMPHR